MLIPQVTSDHLTFLFRVRRQAGGIEGVRRAFGEAYKIIAA